MYNEYRFDQPWDSTANITLDTRSLPSGKSAIHYDGRVGVHGIPYAWVPLAKASANEVVVLGAAKSFQTARSPKVLI